ncbi:c-type cytochrome [Octadecabacter sp. R77987]|uniref:c-type cytochrome n=1 Tax=Octadecabacter sp. R77987 TaxID=3093874 RepID=UPI00366AAAC8
MRHLILAACVVATPVLAQDATEGQGVYLQHCATCHGMDATGNGPMAPAMVVQPPDLTALAAENDGIFPTTRVVWRIDGRDPLVAHGSEMPVFGDFFLGDDTPLKAPSGQPIMTSRVIADLVAYLEGIQR